MTEGEQQTHIAICPGSFDPITNGHLDVIARARRLFGRVIVAVAEQAGKQHLFSVDERVAMVKEACSGMDGVEVDSFDGLVVEYARSRGAVAIVKGMRAVSDFEREMQMALVNRRLAPELHTLFMIAHSDYTFLSSSVVKEVCSLGGDVSDLVPPSAYERLLRLRDRG